MPSIYLDHAATTPTDPRVVEAMLPYFSQHFANANSVHQPGQRSNVAVEEARDTIARLLGAEPAELIFTSGGTESNNTILHGIVKCAGKKGVITSRIEHHAILTPLELGHPHTFHSTLLQPDAHGRIHPEQVAQTITDDTALVSLMHVNNEIGAINPIREIADLCHQRGVLIHTDAVQSVGKMPVKVNELNVDALSLSAHKFYGPKGVGVLYVRNGTPWQSWMQGGSQERRRRGGTLNVPGIIGMAKALELAHKEMDANRDHISRLKSMLIELLKAQFKDSIQFNGDLEHGAYHVVNVSFPSKNGNALDGEMLLLSLDVEGIHCSNGSACTSGAIEPSHVLMGIGLDAATAKSSLRLSLGKANTAEEMYYVVEKLGMVVNRMTR